jgi:hypothetical protein
MDSEIKPKGDVRGVELTRSVYDKISNDAFIEHSNKCMERKRKEYAELFDNGKEPFFSPEKFEENKNLDCYECACHQDDDYMFEHINKEIKNIITALQSAHDVEVKELERKVLDMLPMIYFILIDKKSDSTMRERLMEIKTKINKAFYE